MTDNNERTSTVLQFAAGALLALAGAATSWSAYQSALYDGVQISSYSKSEAIRLQSSAADFEAGQQVMIDISLFLHWLEADAKENQELAAFYQQRFRPEFIPAFDTWIASKPRTNPDALPSPFAHTEYKLRLQQKARQMREKFNETFEAGQQANRTSDKYMLTSVVFGMVMFFAGMSQQFQNRWVAKTLITLAAVMATLGLYALIVLPSLRVF